MVDALVETIQSWNVSPSEIIAMVWDTTSSNTGIHKGSATKFEESLQRAILWLACRHHIGELHIKHANIAVRGATTGMLITRITVKHSYFRNISQIHHRNYNFYPFL